MTCDTVAAAVSPTWGYSLVGEGEGTQACSAWKTPFPLLIRRTLARACGWAGLREDGGREGTGTKMGEYGTLRSVVLCGERKLEIWKDWRGLLL